MSRIDPRLHKLLGGNELAALRLRLRRHFERMMPGTSHRPLRLGSLSATEHEALALLTGRPPRRAQSMLVDIGLLDSALRDAGIADSLRDALERLDGPVVHLASVRAAEQASWSAVAADCKHPALAEHLQSPAALGLLKRLARQDTAAAARLLDAASAVLGRLPADGVPRAQLAAQTLGNAHGLDNGQAVATLVLATWRRIEKAVPAELDPGISLDEPREEASDGISEERTRDVWARAGVLVNELARPALLLNLPVQPDAAPVCTAGEPAYASLRQLLRTPPRWAVAGRTVFVCENPNLVAIAADRLGPRCAALVCTDGMPAAAQRTLLSQLVQAQARLRYHGDFDWAGVQIANHVMRAWGADAWRFGAADYEAAVTSASPARHDLADSNVTATWDAALVPAMKSHGMAIAEEAIAATLLDDLLIG